MTYLPTPPGGGPPPSSDHIQTDFFLATNLQTQFSLTKNPVDPTDVKMTVNGSPQRYGTDYTVLGMLLTWNDVDFTLAGGDKVEITYHF